MKNTLPKLLAVAVIGCMYAHPALAEDAAPDKAEIRKKVNYFKKWDLDGDMKLNREEYAGMVKAQFEKNGKDDYAEEAQKRFKRKDADKDGFVTFEEQNGYKPAE